MIPIGSSCLVVCPHLWGRESSRKRGAGPWYPCKSLYNLVWNVLPSHTGGSACSQLLILCLIHTASIWSIYLMNGFAFVYFLQLKLQMSADPPFSLLFFSLSLSPFLLPSSSFSPLLSFLSGQKPSLQSCTTLRSLVLTSWRQLMKMPPYVFCRLIQKSSS